MVYVIQNKGHLHGYHNEHYCIQQWIYLSISLHLYNFIHLMPYGISPLMVNDSQSTHEKMETEETEKIGMET